MSQPSGPLDHLHNRCALLEAVAGATDVMLVYLDREFNFVWVNEPYARTCRKRPEDMIGRNHFELYPHADNEAIFRRVRDTGEAVFYKDKPFEFPDQPERGVTYWDWSLAPVMDAAGRVEGLVLSLRETTEHKRAQLRLGRYERGLCRFVEQAPISMAMFDRSMNYLAYSRRWLIDYGRGYPDLLGRNHYEVHPDVPEQWKTVHRRCLAGETIRNDEDHWRQADGSDHWMRWAVAPWRDEQDQIGGIIISAEDITERKLSEQALGQSEQRLRWALEAAGGGAWDWDLNLGEAWWSPEMYELWGIEPGSRMRLENSAALVHEQDRDRVVAAVQSSLAGHTDYQCEFRIHHPVRGERWMASRGRAIYDVSGHPLRLLGITQDITERKRIEEQLREAGQRKDEFLAMLAHELRNPLAPIRNAAYVLGHAKLPQTRLTWAREMIENRVAHLARLVDDLLDVSRIARGKITLIQERLVLTDLIHRAQDYVEADMVAKGHRFEVHLPEQSVSLHGDRVRLVQVFQNLLTNAIKFTPGGGRIVLSAQATANEVEIEICDNGVGIASDLLPDIFDLFRQGERALDRSQGGLGVGLTLVRGLVEMHGGRVEAQSAGPGQGASFTVHLPRMQEAEEPPITAEPPPPPAARLRVLVVDDDPAVAESTVIFLELNGYEVRSAGSGGTAVELMKTFRPRVVLLDIGLPGEDGYTVARRMRALPEGRDVLLVAVSGYGHEDAIKHGVEAGFCRHLIKPVAPEELCAVLAEFSEQREGI